MTTARTSDIGCSALYASLGPVPGLAAVLPITNGPQRAVIDGGGIVKSLWIGVSRGVSLTSRFVGSFDELAVLELRAGADERGEVGCVHHDQGIPPGLLRPRSGLIAVSGVRARCAGRCVTGRRTMWR